MMENPLFPLNTISTDWLNPSFTTWAMDMILAFVCGLGLFLLLLPYLQGNPSFPPPRKREKPKKHLKVKKVLYKSKKKRGTLKGYSDRWNKVEKTEDLVSLLQRKLHDDNSFYQLLKEDGLDEMYKPESAGVHQSHPLPVEDALTTAFLPLASLTSLKQAPSTSGLYLPDLMTASVSVGSPHP